MAKSTKIKVAQIKWDSRATPAQNARQHLPQLVAEYFAAGRSKHPLHEIRLATKRLRYALELFRPCYAAGLEARIEKLKALQALLGNANDAQEAAVRLRKLLNRESGDSHRAVQYLDGKAAENIEAFHRYWTDHFDTPDNEKWFTNYLARNARDPA